MSKPKREKLTLRPFFKRYGLFVHFFLFVILLMLAPIDFMLRILALLIHLIAPYVWHLLFQGEYDEVYDPEQFRPRDILGDIHLGAFLAIITTLWMGTTINLTMTGSNIDIYKNPFLTLLTISWGLAVGLHHYSLYLLKQRDVDQKRIADLEAELDVGTQSSERLSVLEDESEMVYEEDTLKKAQYL